MTNRQIIRAQIRSKRQTCSLDEQLTAALLLRDKLLIHPQVKYSQHIALYLSNDGELDLQPFIEACWAQHKNVYLPVLHPFSPGHLLFLRYQADTPLIKNQYGILEPKLNVTTLIPLSELDLIFTPLVAFDKTGQRLGMGGGFYDRTLKKWSEEKESLCKTLHFTPIGLAHDFQQVEHIPAELWDIPLPEIITPTHTYKV